MKYEISEDGKTMTIAPDVEYAAGRVVVLDSSKRFYAACAAMQGMLANGEYNEIKWKDSNDVFIKIVARDAYALADELLKQEKE